MPARSYGCGEKWSKSASGVWLPSQFKWLEHSKLINNQLICPLPREKDTLSPTLEREGALKQCSSVLLQCRGACAYTQVHGTHTHATARTKYSHIKLQLCALKSGRNVQTECIRRRFEHLHEQLPHCFMPPPPATCQPLLLNIFAAGTHIHTCTCRAHIGPIYLYILQVRRKSSSGGLSGPKVLFGSFRVRRGCHGLLIRLSCCVSNRGTEEETGRGGRGMDKRQTERERERERAWRRKGRGGGVWATAEHWLTKRVSPQLVAADSLQFHFRWTHQLPSEWQSCAVEEKALLNYQGVTDK